MPSKAAAANSRRHASGAVPQADAIETAARIGFIAKGVVYGIVGWLAVQSAFTAGGQTTGSQGALATILRESYGEILLLLVAIGLAAYAFWRFVQAIADADRRGTDAKGIAVRTGYFASGAVHAALVVWAARLISQGSGSGGSGSSEGNGAQGLTAELMSTPFGVWLVALVGAAIVAAGVHQFIEGYREKFTRKLRLASVSRRARQWILRTGKLGLIARGLVFGIIGGFLLVAAYRADPQQAKGLGEALRALESATYGPYLLGAVGLGLVCYAIYQFVLARYRVFTGL